MKNRIHFEKSNNNKNNISFIITTKTTTTVAAAAVFKIEKTRKCWQSIYFKYKTGPIWTVVINVPNGSNASFHQLRDTTLKATEHLKKKTTDAFLQTLPWFQICLRRPDFVLFANWQLNINIINDKTNNFCMISHGQILDWANIKSDICGEKMYCSNIYNFTLAKKECKCCRKIGTKKTLTKATVILQGIAERDSKDWDIKIWSRNNSFSLVEKKLRDFKSITHGGGSLSILN